MINEIPPIPVFPVEAYLRIMSELQEERDSEVRWERFHDDPEIDTFRFSSWMSSRLVSRNPEELHYQFLVHQGGIKGLHAEARLWGMGSSRAYESNRQKFTDFIQEQKDKMENMMIPGDFDQNYIILLTIVDINKRQASIDLRDRKNFLRRQQRSSERERSIAYNAMLGPPQHLTFRE